MPDDIKGKGASLYRKDGISGEEVNDVAQMGLAYYEGTENPTHAGFRALTYAAAAIARAVDMPVDKFATFAAEAHLTLSNEVEEPQEAEAKEDTKEEKKESDDE